MGPTQNRPCPFVSWSRDHKVKGPTIRPRKSTNTQAYNEWITTNTSHKHNRCRDGRRAKSKQRRNGNKKKKQPMILYITKETIAINTTHGLRERNKAIIKHLGKYRRSLIRGRARKCKK